MRELKDPDAKPFITVSIAYFRCRLFIAAAVESVLSQTYPNLRVVVVNDGDESAPWSALTHIDDPRLVRFGRAAEI